MTISVFDLYLSRIQVNRTETMMDMSQATIYAQMTTEGRRSLWNAWTQLISQVNNFIIQQDGTQTNKSPITWNGKLLNIAQLKGKFRETWGKGSIR